MGTQVDETVYCKLENKENHQEVVGRSSPASIKRYQAMTLDNIIGGIICAGLAIAYACVGVSLLLMIWDDHKEQKAKNENSI